jgi:hypothetical protein
MAEQNQGPNSGAGSAAGATGQAEREQVSFHPAFETVSVTELPEYRAEGRRFRHTVTGCEVYHISCDDEENLFAFSFKTPPRDSSGVAHILEHTVLCGSQRFPLKDPFLQLLKGSMNTFLNALTFPDKTVYPASSTVPKDLFNMMTVYGDAVFFPLLRKEMFQQEGHRLQFTEKGELERTGIVYNEMKGNYSTHDDVAGDWALRSVLPETPYGHDSGGDPEIIPSLSYEEFLAFHQTYYHPANARIFLYGNIDTERYLSFLEEQFLSSFGPLELSVDIPSQPRWTEPTELTRTFPADPEEPTEGKSSVTLNWLLEPTTDQESVLAFDVLTEILLGHSGSPLERAIVESDLGEDLSAPTGLETELKELVFSTGMRGTDPDKKEAIEELICDVLRRLRDEGIPQEMAEAALRNVEFRNREIRGGPFGLRLMRRALRGWLHGQAPEETLRFESPFEALRRRIESGEPLFEELIDRYLLSNPHRSVVVVRPDPELTSRQKEREQTEFADLLRNLDDEGRAAIERDQAALARLQEEPDPPEALKALPFLTLEDAPREVETIPREVDELTDGVPLLRHSFFTNGISYIDLAFPVDHLDAEELRWMPLFATALTECGLPDMSYDRVSHELSMHTGGVGTHLESSPHALPPQPEDKDEGSAPGGTRNEQLELANRRRSSYFLIRTKSLARSLEAAMHLVSRLLREADFSQEQRIADLIREMRNDFRSGVLPSGHSLVALRSAAKLSPFAARDEQWRGVTQLLHLAEIEESRDAAAIGGKLESIRQKVITRAGLVTSITAGEEALPDTERALRGLVKALPPGDTEADRRWPQLEPPSADEGLCVPATVNYVGAALRASMLEEPTYPAESVLAHLLKTGPLWERIRMEGGAYGAVAGLRAMEGLFSFASYRDPQLNRTIDAYRASLESFSTTEIDQHDLELAILGLVGSEIRPYVPAEKSVISLRRYLYDISDELRQAKRDRLLATTPAQVRAAAERIRAAFDQRRLTVLGGRDAIGEAGGELARNTLDIPI